MLTAGTCALPSNSLLPITYDMCAVDGGASLVNNTLVNLGKAQFSYTNASCNYPSAHAPVKQVFDTLIRITWESCKAS